MLVFGDFQKSVFFRFLPPYSLKLDFFLKLYCAVGEDVPSCLILQGCAEINACSRLRNAFIFELQNANSRPSV